jgi:serine/threonine protein kinase
VTDESFAHGLVGVTLDGRYRLDAVLGVGGMGSVFRATQLAMDRKVAVKLLKPHLTSEQAALQRFAHEARATLKVDSPHAVKILDFGTTPVGDCYMVLEYLDGRTVQRELEIDGPFAPARVAHIARQALSALDAAHSRGLIHRDVKPDNLLLMRVGSDADFTKILDFGVAKLMQGAAGNRSQLALTAAGMVFGTPEFMSPEQACGQELDGRSDLYSLAATMFVMLTGTPLFEGKTAMEWLTHHARTPAPHLAMVNPELAAYPQLDELLQRCLAKHREQRPETAAEMTALIATLEPTLVRTPAAPQGFPRAKVERGPYSAPDQTPSVTASRPTVAPSLTRAPQFHASSYFHALAAAGPAAPATDAPPRVASAPTAGLPPATARPRRRFTLWLGGVAIASLFGAAIGIALRRPSVQSTSSIPQDAHAYVIATATADAGPEHTAPAVAPTSPGSAQVPPVVASIRPIRPVAGTERSPEHRPKPEAPDQRSEGSAESDVVAQVAPVRPVREDALVVAPVRGPVPARNPAAEEHLRNAEDAFRGGNQLRQLAEADLALRADPRSGRAKYLLADALIKGGDLDRGCTYLHALKRYPGAQDRARAAGCSSDRRSPSAGGGNPNGSAGGAGVLLPRGID